jgi:hypothetical protein
MSKIDLGFSRVGTHDTLIVEDDTMYQVSSFDAQPILDEAAELRAIRRGQRWGDITHVGFIPPAIMGHWARDGRLNDPRAVREFLHKNPDFCTFEKFLK